MTKLLLSSLFAIFVYMTLWFIAARARKRLDTVDSAWGGGFFVVSWLVFIERPHSLNILIALLVTIWAGRLTLHIVSRSRTRKEDPRYEELSKKWKGNFWLRAYLSIFLLQGLLIWIISIPIALAGTLPVTHELLFTILGLADWIKGYVIEAIADKQLQDFLATNPPKGSVLDTGLWRYSRHPNYYGEISQWFGIGIIACAAHHGYIGLIGPVVLLVTIVFVSGIPPIENRRKDNPAYQSYKKRTSPLIPWPPKKA